ncbi:ComEC family competence protein [Cryomorpha ignava]|uniref:ComEC family competence protein n=1 Tax=Cryomorpha ignava TaxID=101383 RepID=A0A7K3WUL0_9FLAO|nr:ComEC/Rec2 family competence protein [Cryomorpha ignava]NEN25186.1 ComEC family competence protein [Cryomorpha ignava]
MESIWRQAPFLRLVIPLILGVTAGFSLPLDSVLFKFFLGGTLGCFVVLNVYAKTWKYHRYQMVFGVICSAGLIFAGVALSLQQRLNAQTALILPTLGDSFVGEVVEYPQIKERSVSLLLKLKIESINDELISLADIQVLSYSPHELHLDTLKPGDLVAFKSIPQKHKPPVNPGQFDYGKYLLKNGIAGIVYFHEKIKVERPLNQQFSLMGFFHEVQNYCVEIFANRGLEPRELGVASALILGKRSLILADTKVAFATAGAVHVLAVSGLHVGIIYLVVIGLLIRIFPGKKWRLTNLLITLFILWFYAGITGFSPSVLRAATMFSFIAVGKHSGRRSNIYNMLAVSALLLIILNPSIITEVGFQLSYLAVIGISFFFKPIYTIFIFKSWLPDKVWSLFVVSFAAQLATFPLSIYYFGQFPNLFFITNLVVIPAAMIGLYAGLLTIVFNFIPFLSATFAFILKWTLWGLDTFIEWVSALPLALSENLHFSLLVVIMVYLLIFLLVKFYQNPRKWNLWLPLIIISGLSASWIVRKIVVSRTVEISILEGSKESNLILRQGRKAVVFTSDTSAAQLGSNAFYLNGYFDKAGIDKVEWELYDSNRLSKTFAANSRTIFFNGHTVAHWNAPPSSDDLIKKTSDFVILSKGFKASRDSVFHSGTFYIIDSTIPHYQRKRIMEILLRNNIAFWDMHYQGPFFAVPKHSLAAER